MGRPAKPSPSLNRQGRIMAMKVELARLLKEEGGNPPLSVPGYEWQSCQDTRKMVRQISTPPMSHYHEGVLQILDDFEYLMRITGCMP